MNEIEVHPGDAVKLKTGKYATIRRVTLKGEKTFLHFFDGDQREHTVIPADVESVYHCCHLKKENQL
jgi:hypothetical protein